MRQSKLCIRFIMQRVHVHVLGIIINSTPIFQDVHALIERLEHQLCLRWRSIGLHWNKLWRQGLQDLRNAQQGLMHALDIPVHSANAIRMARHGLVEHDGELPPNRLVLVGPLFLTAQSFVLGDVQEHSGLAADLVHETFREHGFHIIAPCSRPWSAKDFRSRRFTCRAFKKVSR